MARPMWVVKLLKRYFPYRYQFAKTTRFPILSKLWDYFIFRDDQLVYLPKDRVVISQKIEAGGDMVLPSDVVHHFIEQASYHWIMNHCICRQADHCEDYPVDIGCLFLGEAALQISPQLGRLVSKEEAHQHEERAREAGLVHLIGRNRLDSLWLGSKPGNKLMTICNCCPCCCLFRMLPQLQLEISNKITRMPGVEVTVTDDCAACGTCTQGICFVDAIHLDGDRAEISNSCRGCGRCVEVCPQGAIQLEITDQKFITETIQRIGSVVDVE